MTKYSTHKHTMHMTKLGARYHARKARAQGFQAEVQGPYSNWLSLGGRYRLVLT